jgi:hypothetical protein
LNGEGQRLLTTSTAFSLTYLKQPHITSSACIKTQQFVAKINLKDQQALVYSQITYLSLLIESICSKNFQGKLNLQNTVERIIKVHPNSKSNARTCVWAGCILIFIFWLISLFLWQAYKIQLILLICASLIIAFIGVLKYLEPETSFFITPEMIVYCHLNGKWKLPWQDIIRFGQVKGLVRGEHTELPYLGIKLNKLDHIAKTISPRLANKLIHEQQELLVLAIVNKELSTEVDLINFEPYKLNEVIYKGPIAAWLHRSEQLATVYGYHLYLPESSLDRDLNHFLNLLKKCHNYVIVNGPS